ncbi:IS1634 family transposase, partial [Mucilaginibacter psychrotolerans]
MAFLRVENKKSGSYIRIVESYRDGDGHSRHRILYNLGKVSDYTPEQLQRIGSRLYELGGGDLKDLLGITTTEKARFNYGFYQVYAGALAHYGLPRIFSRIAGKHKLQFDFQNATLLMILERLQDPCSKRSTYFNQSEYLGIKPVGLQHLYRALDKLADYNQLIQKQIFQTGRDLFNQRLDVVFYDVTTLYFDSTVEIEEKLRQKGFSKDGKVGKTQILFCMLIDRDKQPIGYKVFKGDTFEGHTFEHAIKGLKDEYQIDKVIVVADRGMLSAANLETTVNNGYEFIVGERLRKLPREVQEPLLDINNYKATWVYENSEEE